ncbi:MAG: chemotaxis response regulator protein-glutamate methylesterase [Acidobacteria bacterium RIFCSPLOWO2_12_FULL_67_14b]|nr:MAG: chemotaxis response regulator protein-glutamate methylesterase [Acidobacteria bacterium RIFCSPLOWO2_12_FULL_67_14b]
MSRIRVLIVDDAVVIRRLVGDVLAADPEIEVVGTAANGRIGLQKITQCNPDVVTMDVEMPDMDGIATLKEIRKTWAKLPVIMFSTLTERGATATLDALEAGASDYVTKPANVGSVTAGLEAVRRDLIPKIKALAGRAALPAQAPQVARPLAPASIPPPARLTGPTDVIAIGVSTGGPNALAALLPALPATLPVPIVIVQHMPPMFTRLLAERLDTQSAIKVAEARAGMTLAAGHAYIAPGDFHMTLYRRGVDVVIALNQDPPENSCRPAVDVLFRSVVAQFGGGTLGAVLTGMGQDGLRGCELIREAGGQVIVQDEASSVVWGMPGFVARAGLAHRVLPLSTIAGELVHRAASIARPGLPARAPGGMALARTS